MLRANEEKSQKTHRQIREAFARRIEDPSQYTIAYGYLVKNGIFGQSSKSFIVAFSDLLKEIVVIPINYEIDEIGDAIRLSKDIISSAKFGFQGDIKIKSDILNKPLRFIVPPYTPPILENAYILPINQEKEAEAFKRFIKGNF
jgi:hypothetical protein